MAYTSVSKTDERKLVRVQLPPSAPCLTVNPKEPYYFNLRQQFAASNYQTLFVSPQTLYR